MSQMNCKMLTLSERRIIERNAYRERLIALVSSNPILWDKQSLEFTHRTAKLQKWKDLARQLGVSTDKVRRTWENLRDQYRRDLKRTMSKGIRSKWRFFDDMSFIRNMVRIKGGNSVRDDDESESDFEELTSDNISLSVLTAMSQAHTPTSPNAAIATATTTSKPAVLSAVNNFQTIHLSTEWRQQEAAEQQQKKQQQQLLRQQQHQQLLPKQLHQLQQIRREQQPKLFVSQEQQQQNIEQQQEQLQQNCDSSEEQRVDDEFFGDVSEVVKIEIDSDSNDAALRATLQQQQQQQQQSLTEQLQREPRPNAPRPSDYLLKIDSEACVSTSDQRVVSVKRRHQDTNESTTSSAADCSPRKFRPTTSSPIAPELQDEDYHFVMSILPSLRQVSRQRKFPLRTRIMTLISQEFEDDGGDNFGNND